MTSSVLSLKRNLSAISYSSMYCIQKFSPVINFKFTRAFVWMCLAGLHQENTDKIRIIQSKNEKYSHFLNSLFGIHIFVYDKTWVCVCMIYSKIAWFECGQNKTLLRIWCVLFMKFKGRKQRSFLTICVHFSQKS